MFHELIHVSSCGRHSFDGRLTETSPALLGFLLTAGLGLGAAAWGDARHEDGAVIRREVDEADARTTIATTGVA